MVPRDPWLDDEPPRIRNPRKYIRETLRLVSTMKKLREIYANGRASLEMYPTRVEYGSMTKLEDEGKSGELLRKARAFANPETGYSRPELDRLIAHCEEEQFPLGASFVYRLLAVTKGRERGQMQHRCIEQRWSRQKLDAEIARLFGNRRPAVGRKLKLSRNPSEALYRLQRQLQLLDHLFVTLNSVPAIQLPSQVSLKLKPARAALTQLLRSIDAVNLSQRKTVR